MREVLVEWLKRGRAPGDLVQVTQQSAPPMCRYPAYPRYRGSGDPRLAESFECVASK